MTHRINVILEDEVWARFQAVPKGERSKLINQAISETLLRQQRAEAFAQIEVLRASMNPVPGTTEEWVREDRDQHG